MAARDGHIAAAQRGAMADGVSEISGHSAVPTIERWNEPERVQDHLLVGMGTPAHRSRDWHGFLRALGLVSVARLDTGSPSGRIMGHPRSWRAPRRDRMVDGGLRPCRSRRSLAIPVGDASRPCLPDLRRLALDRSAVAERGAAAIIRSLKQNRPTDGRSRRRHYACGAPSRADLSRCIGGWFAGRTCIQYLAADRWRSLSAGFASTF